jgi:hypothetical protein
VTTPGCADKNRDITKATNTMTHPSSTPSPTSRDIDTNTNTKSTDADDGKTTPGQDGSSVPRLPHERDQTAGDQGTQDHRDNQEETKTGIGKRAYDDATGETTDTSYAPMTDKVYNDKVKP